MTFQIYGFNEATAQFKLLGKTKHTSTILAVEALVVPAEEGRQSHCLFTDSDFPPGFVVIVGGTDGTISFIDVSAEIVHYRAEEHISHTSLLPENTVLANSLSQPFHTLNEHIAGVNCLAVEHLKEREWLIASGGDDQRLFVARFKLKFIQHSWTISYSEHFTVSIAHNAAITGKELLVWYSLLKELLSLVKPYLLVVLTNE